MNLTLGQETETRLESVPRIESEYKLEARVISCYMYRYNLFEKVYYDSRIAVSDYPLKI